MPRNSARIALTSTAFLVGVGIGAWLARPREAPKLRTYDREAAAQAREAKARSVGLRWTLEQWKRGDGGSTGA